MTLYEIDTFTEIVAEIVERFHYTIIIFTTPEVTKYFVFYMHIH